MQVRENFCGMCMAVPVALAGAGVAGIATNKQYQQKKKL